MNIIITIIIIIISLVITKIDVTLQVEVCLIWPAAR
jgi:hypothetical protein